MKLKAIALEMLCLESRYKKLLKTSTKVKAQECSEIINCEFNLFVDLLNEKKPQRTTKSYKEFEQNNSSIVASIYYDSMIKMKI